LLQNTPIPIFFNKIFSKFKNDRSQKEKLFLLETKKFRSEILEMEETNQMKNESLNKIIKNLKKII